MKLKSIIPLILVVLAPTLNSFGSNIIQFPGMSNSEDLLETTEYMLCSDYFEINGGKGNKNFFNSTFLHKTILNNYKNKTHQTFGFAKLKRTVDVNAYTGFEPMLDFDDGEHKLIYERRRDHAVHFDSYLYGNGNFIYAYGKVENGNQNLILDQLVSDYTLVRSEIIRSIYLVIPHGTRSVSICFKSDDDVENNTEFELTLEDILHWATTKISEGDFDNSEADVQQRVIDLSHINFDTIRTKFEDLNFMEKNALIKGAIGVTLATLSAKALFAPSNFTLKMKTRLNFLKNLLNPKNMAKGIAARLAVGASIASFSLATNAHEMEEFYLTSNGVRFLLSSEKHAKESLRLIPELIPYLESINQLLTEE